MFLYFFGNVVKNYENIQNQLWYSFSFIFLISHARSDTVGGCEWESRSNLLNRKFQTPLLSVFYGRETCFEIFFKIAK
jgi:hypothetical protein